MFDDIDFSPGIIAYNGTEFLDQEDIFQISYNDGRIIIDVGWYRKEFAVVIIKDFDWDNPLMEKRCVDLNMLYDLVQDCSEYVREIRG
ncbi:hypothetical protein [Paenibacillus xylanexedens]|uniref:hypothetical protein n=1 Tax=Paenibacillus xylanexedens TaxID=528191 RepID=UPI000F544B02|nr:hypothetical protein [Paenibacillus xylanexedens]RPK31275.1 hypothetical protein EDO6_01902 [Paenibacillus xylanexedens]